jgi:hypothetical protein
MINPRPPQNKGEMPPTWPDGSANAGAVGEGAVSSAADAAEGLVGVSGTGVGEGSSVGVETSGVVVSVV